MYNIPSCKRRGVQNTLWQIKNINNMLKNNKKKVELLFYNQKYPKTKTYERKKIKYILLGFESIEPPCFLKRRRLFYVSKSTVF